MIREFNEQWEKDYVLDIAGLPSESKITTSNTIVADRGFAVETEIVGVARRAGEHRKLGNLLFCSDDPLRDSLVNLGLVIVVHRSSLTRPGYHLTDPLKDACIT